ncbi:DUF2278 family protein [Dyadobacter flavalbus]|uniref:DUF2278 family protein n=1 Tax=Dyadobacter flavalbus TaxID=2579942 RepID=A0A5M8QSL7_9BACT|nr:DUF2278 family protein [Dyadobacter flavalbus]KAA6439257.1 DUF2278 family protein [Dyadobacter flavalbus]
MPLKNYSILKALVIGKKLATSSSPHYQILVQDESGMQHRVAVNAKSQLPPSELLYYFDDDFQHELTDKIAEADLPSGFTSIASRPDGLALDFVRRNLFDTSKMKALPLDLPGPDNDLNEKLDFYIKKAVGDPTVVLYAFGEKWGSEPDKKDQYFGFLPGSGIHDIHMNQGNEGRFERDNGIWQDGGILLHFTLTDQWVALFLAFQSQSFHTDDSGNAVSEAPSQSSERGDVYIIAALASPESGQQEKVYLLNASGTSISLDGFVLTDMLNRRHPLDGKTIGAGEMLIVMLDNSTIQLGNNGGTLSLLDPDGKTMDGVSYTKKQSGIKGKLIVFSK